MADECYKYISGLDKPRYGEYGGFHLSRSSSSGTEYAASCKPCKLEGINDLTYTHVAHYSSYKFTAEHNPEPASDPEPEPASDPETEPETGDALFTLVGTGVCP